MIFKIKKTLNKAILDIVIKNIT